MFVNFDKSQYFYFMHLNTYFSEGVRRFHQTLKEAHGIKTIMNLYSTSIPLILNWGLCSRTYTVPFWTWRMWFLFT